ncbi:hypothetical protein EB796_003050 [Bugula neritina]|uniref:Vacuolar protein sorting-associated protein 13 VPS13 adaptor binding domain-containing protein n=1 Tax=Bugula neritina TaxID=10212 RepID=A0A7J7KK64_BUGNE|nr:hypothetical protein EB796_003050 [Bugula neritina]
MITFTYQLGLVCMLTQLYVDVCARDIILLWILMRYQDLMLVTIVVSSAGVVAVTATYHKRSGTVNIPSPIKEEEIVEEVITPTQSLLQSTGPPPAVPTILFTQASRVDMEFDENEDQKVDGVNTPSVCQSVADRDEETGNTTVDEKEATPEVMCTYLSLVSRDRLLLTISPQGLNVVSCIVDTLTKKPTDSTLFEVSKSYALTITNLLGIPACVALHANSRQRGRGIKLENVRLSDHVDVSESSATEQQQSGENTLKSLAKLTSPTTDATRKVFGLSSPPPVTLKRQALHLAVDGYIPIPNILFRRTQSMDFMARPRNQRADSLCIRVKTQTKHGKKLVSIYSQLKIRNEFSCPVQISYSEVSYDESNQQHVPVNKSLGVVEPGAMLYIPAVVAQQKKLHVKPITDAESDSAGDFGESNETLWWRDHLKAKASFRSSSTKRSYAEIFEFLTCTNQLQQTFCFKAVWVGRKCMADNCQGNCPSFDVLLQPPAEIKNFLPFNIKLEVQINSSSLGTRPNTYDLEPGETRHIYDAISTPKRCYLVIPNYLDKSWKGVIDVHDSMSVNRMTDITLVAETDAEQPNESAEATNQVTVTSHVTRAQSDRCSNGQLQITFFASYWISNTTNKTLQFKRCNLRLPSSFLPSHCIVCVPSGSGNTESNRGDVKSIPHTLHAQLSEEENEAENSRIQVVQVVCC